ncbi:PD-(D/E)XK nuclease family protein [Brevibacillus sp. H7]|uniref:PD-(D/E)XK nuclease family protein n=1 Tax=Brevibacillus sp. H7 TaxID=3349138 RepID=UPI00381342A6
MNPLYPQLDDICKAYPFQKKILLVPSHRLGNQLLQSLVLQGKSYLNLSVDTLENLALQHCKQHMFVHKLQLVPVTLAKHYLFGVLEKLQSTNQLDYFHETKISPSFVHAFHSSLMDLKMAGFSPDTISVHHFVNPKKGMDIKRILQAYNDHLQQHHFLDAADLCNLALSLPAASNVPIIFLLPSHQQLYPLQQKCLDHISNATYRLLEPAAVQPEAKTNKDRLFWLHDITNSGAPFQDETVQLIKAYGERNEVKETFRRIKTRNIPFDQCAVFYTTQDPYAQLFYELSARYEIPVTFGEGINIRNTRPGRLFFTLLTWIHDRYSQVHLLRLLDSGDFQVDDSWGLSPRKMGRMLRSAGIGWEKQRYVRQLEQQVARCLQKSADAEDEEKKAYYQQKAEQYSRLRDVMEKLFSGLPESDRMESVHYGAFTAALLRIIEKHSRVISERDAEAKAKMEDELTLLKQYADEEMPLEDAIQRLQDTIGGLRVGASGPKPGHLHVDHFRAGMYQGRKHHIIVGLDNRKFPGNSSDDPILLDKERQLLGQALPLRANQTKERLFEMEQCMRNTTESLTLSYSCVNPLENKELYPAAIMLQVYRMLTGDEAKDYSQLIRHFPTVDGYIPHQETVCLDENDWWLHQVIRQGVTQQASDTVLQLYPFLQNGQMAKEAREKPFFTHYDGRVQVNPGELDPRRNKNLSLSPSKLETLASCPYAFFIAHILGVQKPDELVYDPGAWLSPTDRGSLLHEIFERFLRGCKEEGIRPKVESHLQPLQHLADEILAAYKEIVPPPSELVYEKERKEILGSCQVFLLMEEDIESEPEHFELLFGKQTTPVEIPLPSGYSYFIDGKIDRVDRKPDGTYSIVDYKTGSTYGYSDKEYFKGGRQLQHALYAIAFEEYSRMNDPNSTVAVSESGYVFPTRKGEGVRFLRPQQKREEFLHVNENLLDILANGHFTMTDDPSDCKYCDFKQVCNRHKIAEEVLAEKRNDHTAVGLSAFREVRTYE